MVNGLLLLPHAIVSLNVKYSLIVLYRWHSLTDWFSRAVHIHSINGILTVNTNYCDSSNLPQLENATAMTPVNSTVIGVNYFSCNYGLQSSGGSTLPFYSCETLNSTNGQWSIVTNYCIRTNYIYIYYCFPLLMKLWLIKRSFHQRYYFILWWLQWPPITVRTTQLLLSRTV